MQCFGTYDTKEEAVSAHDIAVLLIHGPNSELNRPITDYVDISANTFHPHVEIPAQVRASVSAWKYRHQSFGWANQKCGSAAGGSSPGCTGSREVS
jgi:hypothetical protein